MNKLTRNIIFYIVFTICLLLITTPLIKNNLMRKTIKFEPYTGRTIGTATDLNNCTYTTDDVNKTITITKFDSSQMSTDKELNVFGQYKLDDITYSTIIESNGEGSLFPTTLSSLYFRGEEVKWKGNAEYLFKNYKNLTSVYFGNTNYIDSSNTSFKGMFSGCSNLVVVEFENANFERVTDISYMFENCIELTNTFNTLEFGNFTASNVTNMSHMFDGCEKLINIDISKFNTSKVTDMSYMFNGCSELTQLNLDNFITDKVTDMSGMFVNCSKLTTLNLNHFNTSRVINMSYMFSRCSALKSINIGNWNTSRVEKMDYLFYECSSLTNIDIDSWDTSNVYWMQGMFAYCRKLNSIDLNSWNTSKVTWTDSMFAGCTNLTDINIKDWDVSKVQTIGSMFLDCYSLVNIDISKWSNSISNDYDDMFKNCSKIEMLDISNLEIIGIGGANMFEGCNFDILVTPKSILEYGEYRLPYIMYDDYGIGYTELPTTSKTLYKERPIPKYKVTLETNGGEINSGEVTQYTEGEEVTLPEDVTKEGYNFAGWYDNEGLTGSPVTSIPSTATGDKTFYAKWERNTFTVTFKDGTERTNVQTVNSGENATAPNWTKPGYTLTWDKTFTNVTTDITVNAIWIAKTNTAYTVEHHLQNLSKTAYEKDAMATENRTGTTNTQTAAIAKTYTGFTAQPIEQKTISGNGTTVVIVKYNRNTYTITLNPSEGTLPEGSQIIEYIYGEEKELPDPIRPGYNFDGWYDEEGNEIEKITPTDDGDKQLEANWTAKTDTPYKIIHHFRNLDLESEGFINEEEAKTGTTGTQVTAQYKEREGFTKNESDTRTVKEGIIAGDGSLVLHLYYTRNTYNIEYELNGGTIN
ncbi:MAG: BspA family leucine-rich repeat surface protein, partial [Clostridia bacterium]|nr:BspA family leucine-rich repeat surface protein [Clostridia bacterium]